MVYGASGIVVVDDTNRLVQYFIVCFVVYKIKNVGWFYAFILLVITSRCLMNIFVVCWCNVFEIGYGFNQIGNFCCIIEAEFLSAVFWDMFEVSLIISLNTCTAVSTLVIVSLLNSAAIPFEDYKILTFNFFPSIIYVVVLVSCVEPKVMATEKL